MRVAICADMVGLSGIDGLEQCFPAWPAAYRHGVRMLVGDVTAAIEGALDAGATEIVLADWHHLGRNIPEPAFPDLPIRRLWETGRPLLAPGGLGRPEVAILVGAHAAAGNPRGFLSHTFWPGMAVLLGGRPVPEALLWGLALGAAGTRVAAIAGDQPALEEALPLLPGVHGVALKAGKDRTSAMLRPTQDAREELTEAVGKAVAGPPPPISAAFPEEASIVYGRSDHAGRAARAGVGERSGERRITTTIGSVHDLTAFLARALLATPLATAASIEHAVLPIGRRGWRRPWGEAATAATRWIDRRAARALAEEPADRYPAVPG